MRKVIRDRVVALAREGHPPSVIKDMVGSVSVASVKVILSQERKRGVDVPRFTPHGTFADSYEYKRQP